MNIRNTCDRVFNITYKKIGFETFNNGKDFQSKFNPKINV